MIQEYANLIALRLEQPDARELLPDTFENVITPGTFSRNHTNPIRKLSKRMPSQHVPTFTKGEPGIEPDTPGLCVFVGEFFVSYAKSICFMLNLCIYKLSICVAVVNSMRFQ